MFFFQDVLVGRGGLHTHAGAGEKASFPPCGVGGGVGGCTRELLVLLES